MALSRADPENGAIRDDVAIDTDGLTKVYERGLGRTRIRALDDLSLKVAAGQIFGLLGPNGAGKTTLVKILLGVVRPTGGRAALLGIPVERPAARQDVGYLPEHHRFPGHLTPAELLDLSGALAGVPRRTRRTRARELLERVRMNEWSRTPIKKLSKGMMQRVGLAAALMPAPRIVVLDEPTDGVDPVGRVETRDILLGLREEGVTIFLNSHLLSEVERVCDRVAMLARGRLVAQGAVDELTQLRSQYLIEPAGEPAFLAERLRSVGIAAESVPPAILVRVGAPEDINHAIDRLRGWGVTILAVTPRRTSLEDVFVQAISAEGAGAVGGEQIGRERVGT